MRCSELNSYLPRFLEDALSEHENLLFQQHLRECDYCRIHAINAGKSSQVQNFWLRITTVLNVLLVISAIIYFAYGPLIGAYFKKIWNEMHGVAELSGGSGAEGSASGGNHKVLANVQLRPLHWDLYFSDRSRLEGVVPHLRRTPGIKVLYEDSGLLILNVNHESVSSLVSIMGDTGGGFQGGGSVYSFNLPDFEGNFRISINLKFPQSRVSQPLAHHWHLNFQLPNRFVAKEAVRETGARFLYEAPELWVVQIPGRDFNQLKEVLRSTHGVEVDFGRDNVSADSYGKIPVTVSIYISEG